jgi:hypothetical protein
MSTTLSKKIVTIFDTSLSGYALLNAARRAADDFDARGRSRMNIRAAREYSHVRICVAFAQL